MTRKDYVAIATSLSRTKPPKEGSAAGQWRIDIQSIADALRADNPRFDRNQFLDACYDVET